MSRTKTQHIQRVLTEEAATELYNILKESLPWRDGIPSRRHGFTRRACALNPEHLPLEVLQAIQSAAHALNKNNVLIHGVYVNYYENGTHWTPNHSHPGSVQWIISLGATRTFTIGKKSFAMANGDVAIFGGAIHGIPREPHVVGGRISIAVFTEP
jgi:hypothetical protein